jgi:EmrB/QacA subfamily drug resistance transporter
MESRRVRRLSRRRLVFLAACLAIFMASVEATIVATAIPTIVADLGGLRLFSWVFGIYFLTQCVTIPIYGRLADLYGRKKLIIIAVAVFLLGSILCAFARDMVWLIVFRGLQGLGAGGVQPLASTIVGDLFSGKDRARVQGYLSTTWGISAVAGPLLGAFLIRTFGWPTIFWVNVPVGIVCVAIIVRFFDETIERKAHRIDYLGSVLLAAGVGTLMFVLVSAGNLAPALTLGLAVLAVVLIGLLIAHELRTPEPMMPVRLWRLKVIALANGGNFGLGAQMMGVTAFLPTYVQGVTGGSAVLAGSTLGTMSIGWVLAALVGSRILPHITYRRLAVAGGVFLVAGGAALATLAPGRSIVLAFAGAGCLGIGFGLVNLVYVVTVQSAVGWEQRGTATASNLFLRQLGQAIGTAAFGAVFNLGLALRIPDATGVVTQMMEPVRRHALALADVQRDALAIAASLHVIYLIVATLGVFLLILAIAIPAHLRPTETAPSLSPRA